MFSSKAAAYRAIHVAGTRSAALISARVASGAAIAMETMVMVIVADDGTAILEHANAAITEGAVAKTPPAVKDAAIRTKVSVDASVRTAPATLTMIAVVVGSVRPMTGEISSAREETGAGETGETEGISPRKLGVTRGGRAKWLVPLVVSCRLSLGIARARYSRIRTAQAVLRR